MEINCLPAYFYYDTSWKPVLFSREYAEMALRLPGVILSRPSGERTDHPHHIGIWFNYENVNGLISGIILMLSQKKKKIYMDG